MAFDLLIYCHWNRLRSSRRLLATSNSKKSTSSNLLVGSIDTEDELEEFDSFEEGLTKSLISIPDSISLYMRAIISSSLPSESSIVALVQMREEVVAWTQRLASIGLPVSSIQIVSVTPHAPKSIEEKLQAELMFTQQELRMRRKGADPNLGAGSINGAGSAQDFSGSMQTTEMELALWPFILQNMHFMVMAAALIIGVLKLLLHSSKRRERVASNTNLVSMRS